MEWLSHSQKKHCELCKTSFRFTKLYAPDMPQSLPLHIFLEHMAKYLARNLLNWIRATLAISIWICWLPLLMRAAWSCMFWISDEGLGGALMSQTPSRDLASTAVITISTVCPVTPLAPKTTTSLSEAAFAMSKFDAVTSDIYCPQSHLQPGPEEMTIALSRTFTNTNLTTHVEYSCEAQFPSSLAMSSSLFSNVTFLRNLTRSQTVNRAVTSIIEGQVITILVIICFILVILVRDYVVQQQPELNMRAAFADIQDRAQAAADEQNNAPRPNDHFHGPNDAQQPHLQPEPVPEEPVEERPAPTRPTAEQQASVIEFLRVHRRAEGDPARIIQIIEEEGLEDRLQHWLDVSRRAVANPNYAALETRNAELGGPSSAADADQSANSGYANSDSGYPSDIGERDIEVASSSNRMGPSTSNTDTTLPGYPYQTSAEGATATSPLNPLGNNSWSFSDLPDETSNNNGDSGPFAGPSLPRQDAQSEEHQYHSHHDLHPDIDVDGNADGSSSVAPPPFEEGTIHHQTPGEEDTEDTAGHIDAQVRQEEAHAVHVPPGDNEPISLVDRVANFMWGDLDQQAEELALQAMGGEQDHEDEWIDVPMAGDGGENDHIPPADDAVEVPPGFDQEAIEDMEDFEGVMELIGMRGPLAGLFQNAIFCAVLVSVTIFACIFVPYNIGRVTVWIMASPMRLVRMIVEISKLIQDAVVMVVGFLPWCVINFIDLFTVLFSDSTAQKIVAARKASWAFWTQAGSRVVEYLFMDFPMSATEIQNFSAISHDALLSVKGHISHAVWSVENFTTTLYSTGLRLPSDQELDFALNHTKSAWRAVASSSTVLLNPSAWVIDLGGSEDAAAVDPLLAHWSGTDRFWAIMAGYATVYLIAAMYLKRDSPFSTGQVMRAWEAGIIDTLQQASGIMKVILIISIEMLIFPLYCGMLLDLALLPLFAGTTVVSRLMFTYDYPLTSAFVHWFVGTGYMFHFALFVSMCRKIMRPGVLCKYYSVMHMVMANVLVDFIRDPDDPEFHPVRDVLERNLSTQLRKILFSAFVYGALVIVCLGGVVWGLSYTLPTVLPIHYSSNEPVLEFPVDLLFYNFLMPLAVKFFKPSDGIHSMCTWWFRRCARGLRLTFFLFGDRKVDEEGDLQLAGGSDLATKFYDWMFLGLDSTNNVVSKSWQDAVAGDVSNSPTETDVRAAKDTKKHLVESGQLKENGRFVRAPASDRVKIPKGQKVFVASNEDDERQDEGETQGNDEIYNSEQYRLVYVPPRFRARIFLFILFIWLFAAFTGVGLTIAPLVIGRTIFKALIPDYVRTNDIYAFSIGIYLLGSAIYLILHCRTIWAKAKTWLGTVWQETTSSQAADRVLSAVCSCVKFAYAYFFLGVVFPLLVSALVELYVALPLHTYMNPPTAESVQTAGVQDAHEGRHTVRVMQAWTLGLLYLKLGTKMITSLLPQSRAALAVQAVMRRGWLHPDTGLFTRAFVIPGLTVSAMAIFGPPLTAKLLINFDMVHFTPQNASDAAGAAAQVTIYYRHSYPVAALGAIVVKNAFFLASMFHKWTAGVRDEAYLIGERLHNFGAATAGARKGRNAWKTGSTRL